MNPGTDNSRSASERIRVLEIAGGWGLGGSEQAIQLRSLLLDQSRYEVLALGLESGGPRLDYLSAKGISTKVCSDGISSLEEIISEFKPHIIHYGRSASHSKLIVELSRLAKEYQANAFVETNVFGRPGLDRMERQPDLVAHMSCASFLKCARAVGSTSDDLYAQGHTVVYLPVPQTLYTESEVSADRDAARESLGLSPSDFVACRVARPDIRKWSSVLELALPRLFREIPNLKFLFQALPDEKTDTLKQLFGDRVICLQPTADLQKLTKTYVASDVMIHSSGIGESFGLCVAEAMYFGLPVVVDSTPSLDNAQVELVQNESTGFVVQSSRGFVSAAKRLAENQDLMREMGDRAKQIANDYFVDDQIAKQWDHLYSRLMNSGNQTDRDKFERPKALIVSEADYQTRLQQTWGPKPGLSEKSGKALLRFKDTLKYARKVGFSSLFRVLLSRLRAGKLTRS